MTPNQPSSFLPMHAFRHSHLKSTPARAIIGVLLYAMLISGVAFFFPAATIHANDSLLTPEERSWLKAHNGHIRLAPCPHWEPMEFFDQAGRYSGLVADYIKLIEERLGLHFKIVKASTWAEVLELARQKKIDVIPAAYDTPERRSFMRWTAPYLEVPEVIVTRKSLKQNLALADLVGMRVGVTAAYVVADWIQNQHPDISLIMVPNDQVGLRMVSFGELDAMIAEFPIASHAIEKEKITNLRVAGQTGFSARLSIGVRKDWPLLADIMVKGLALITEAERQEIYARWINLGGYSPYLNKRFGYAIVTILLVILAIATLVFAWNITLRRKVTQKTVALTQELNQRRCIDAALRESEKRLTTLIANLPGMAYRHYIATEDHWPMEYISSGCHELTGYRHLCRPGNETEYYDKVVHPQDKAWIRQVIKGALACREPFRLTYRILAADGSQKWVWEQGVGIYADTGELLQVEGFITDITGFKQAEDALSRSRQLFQDLVLNSLIGICIVRGGAIVFQNPEQERLFGPLPPDFDLYSCINIHPEDATKFKQFLAAALSDHHKSLEPDVRLFPFNPNGSDRNFRWVHCRASCIQYKGRESLLLNMMDVTRARELEHFVSVQDKMSSLGRVAAGMAHEIRSPLSGINIHVGVARKKLRTREPADFIHDDLKQIQTASRTIETVIRRVMDFAKPGVPRFRPMDIHLSVRQAIGLCAVSLRKSSIQLQVDLFPQALLCRADKNLIQQVLLNLITNAAEALQNTPGPKIIHLITEASSQQILVRVADSGPGIAKTIADRIFDPFFTTKREGTGIGLSISRRIVMDHHGTLLLGHSTHGGAEFILKLPQIEEKK